MRIDAMSSFLKLVETGSYPAAAEALYSSTSTVHGQIKSLEADLGTELVLFTGRTLRLTQAGSKFLVFAERTLADYQGLKDELEGRTGPPPAAVRIVALPSMASYLLPPAVRAFSEVRPETRVLIDGRRIGEAIAALVSGQADIAVLLDSHSVFADEVYEITELAVTDSVLAVRSSSEYAGEDPLKLLERLPISAQPGTNMSRQYFERWARARDLKVSIRYEHSLQTGILNDILAGDCIGLIAEYFAELMPHGDQLTALDVPQFQNRHSIVAVYARHANLMARECVMFLRDFCRASGVAHREHGDRRVAPDTSAGRPRRTAIRDRVGSMPS